MVTNEEVMHLWAHQAQETAEARNGSMRFYGTSIYKYGQEVGRIVLNSKGEESYLYRQFNSGGWGSPSTYDLLPSLPPGRPSFDVGGSVDRSPEEILRDYLHALSNLKAIADRARSNKAWRLKEVVKHIEMMKRFNDFFGLENAAVEALYTDDLQDAVKVAEAAFTEYLRKREERRRKDQEERLEKSKESLAKWLQGEHVYLGYLGGLSYMRVRGDEVHTTMGAVVPISHVQRAAPFILAMIDKVKEEQTNYYPNHAIRLGHYKLECIDIEGTVRVGCHLFAESEIRRFAEVLKGLDCEEKENTNES
jgi:hypothetical protein